MEGFTILVTDVTEARQAAAGLAATNQRLQSALAREALVNQISRAARGSADADAILRSTVAALGPAVGADRCYYVTYDLPRDHGTLGPDWHREGLASVAGEYRLSDYTPNRNLSYLAGNTDVVEDAFALPDNGLAVKLGLRSLVRVPLQRGELMTALVVAMAHETRRWTPDEVALVETVAAQTRAAVESSRASQRERLLLTDVLASVTEGKLQLVGSCGAIAPAADARGGRHPPDAGGRAARPAPADTGGGGAGGPRRRAPVRSGDGGLRGGHERGHARWGRRPRLGVGE